METGHGIKYRQLHIEDYLREIPAEQGRETVVYLSLIHILRVRGGKERRADYAGIGL